MEIVIELHWRQWYSDPRTQVLFEQAPFGMELLIDLMLECWWALEEEPYLTSEELIIDILDSYGLEDHYPEAVNGQYNPEQIWKERLEPHFPLIYEIVYNLFITSRLQLYPVYNNAALGNGCKLVLKTLFSPTAVVLWLERNTDTTAQAAYQFSCGSAYLPDAGNLVSSIPEFSMHTAL